jgi:CRP/FNR family transcriptional regulator
MPSFNTPGTNPDDFDAIVPVFSPAINAGTEFLQSLPEPEPIPAKTVILEQGQRPSFVRLIRTGIVKITFTNEQGEESLLGLRSEGWWAGAPLALLDMPSLCNVTTVTPCSVTSISVDQFSQRLMQNQRVLRHFISSQCRELMVEQKHGIVQGCSASERLNYLKNENAHSLWRTVDPSSVMCQGEIAKLLAITPEHLSRLLHRRTAAKPGTGFKQPKIQRATV